MKQQMKVNAAICETVDQIFMFVRAMHVVPLLYKILGVWRQFKRVAWRLAGWLGGSCMAHTAQ